MDADGSFYTAEEIRSRLSISTLVFHGYRPLGESALAELARYGFRRIELLESSQQFDMTDSQSMKIIGEACRERGIEIGAYHAHSTHFSELATEEKRLKRVDFCRRQIDTMLELGGKIWGSHAQAADAVMAKSYEELARHVEGTDAIITVENFTREGVSVENRVRFLDALDHPQVGMILDIGHVRDENGVNPMTLPGGPTRVLELCGHRLRHIHLHGFKEGRDHFPPLAAGDEIQWRELLRMLRSVDYPGYMNFEPSGDPVHSGTLEQTSRAPERLAEIAM